MNFKSLFLLNNAWISMRVGLPGGFVQPQSFSPETAEATAAKSLRTTASQ
jgi:hypothetical protein